MSVDALTLVSYAALPTWYLVTLAFVAGTVFGSFANVVIYRVPKGLSVVKPGSRCPHCGHELSWWENLPLISYAMLKGKCRECKAPISIRYPLVELLIGLLWAVVTLKFGLVAELPAYLALVTVLVILSATDLEHRRIPNKILGPATILAVVFLLIAAAARSDFTLLGRAAIGGALYGLPMFAIGLAAPAAMGFGDIKLAGYLGLHLGWLGLGVVGVGAFLGFFIGAAIGVGLIVAGRKGRKDFIPFGPSMALGALIAVFFGRALLDLWMGALT